MIITFWLVIRSHTKNHDFRPKNKAFQIDKMAAESQKNVRENWPILTFFFQKPSFEI
jgi:hypothetical protein